MRIIGGKDYYDGANYGIDKDIVFVRNEYDISFPENKLPLQIDKDLGFYSRRNEGTALNLVYIFFAGEVYPALRVITSNRHKDGCFDIMRVGNYEDVFEWSKEAFQSYNVNYIYDYDSALEVTENIFNDISNSNFIVRDSKKSLYNHFNFNKSITDWAIDNRIVTGYLQKNLPAPGRASDTDDKTKRYIQKWNGDFMSFVQFFKVKDAYTANQDISMFVGGILPKLESKTVELNNEERIQKAGFDLKVSFRNM